MVSSAGRRVSSVSIPWAARRPSPIVAKRRWARRPGWTTRLPTTSMRRDRERHAYGRAGRGRAPSRVAAEDSTERAEHVVPEDAPDLRVVVAAGNEPTCDVQHLRKRVELSRVVELQRLGLR